MNKIRLKLTSQSGASITYALLLFLVCAVVSSVVIAAATAAAGRMSKSVENDQRYYSVSSAAELLRNKLDKASHTLEWDDANQDKTINGAEMDSIMLDSNSFSPTSSPLSITQYASAAAAGLLLPPVDGRGLTAGSDDLEVSIKEKVNISDPDCPLMVLEISNVKDASKGLYTLTLTFTGAIEDTGDVDNKKGRKNITWDFYSLETKAAEMKTE